MKSEAEVACSRGQDLTDCCGYLEEWRLAQMVEKMSLFLRGLGREFDSRS